MLFARAARENGVKVYAAAHEGETDPALSDWVEDIQWVRLGQLNRILDFFRTHGIRDAVMAGGITKTKMFNWRPDLRTLMMVTRMRDLHDDHILRTIAEEFEKEHITIQPSTLYTPQLLAPEGVLSKRKPDKDELRDIEFGWGIAKALGRLDIGQCVVVRNMAALALEAIDGTDATIRRGGALGREKVVVVKVSKPTQDMRFDVPSVGPQTIAVMAEVKASVLAIEAGCTLMFDREEMISLANRAGIAVVARKGE